MLQDLGWKPRWVNHLGCLKGCLDHIGVEASDGWLYGVTGHAFVLNMHAPSNEGEPAMQANMADPSRRDRAIDAVLAAREAEEQGLRTLELIVDDLRRTSGVAQRGSAPGYQP